MSAFKHDKIGYLQDHAKRRAGRKKSFDHHVNFLVKTTLAILLCSTKCVNKTGYKKINIGETCLIGAKKFA